MFKDLTPEKFDPGEVLNSIAYDCVIITTYIKKDSAYRELLRCGVRKQDVQSIFPLIH